MTLTQLRYALAVLEHGSISAAARACYVSQPSLSEGLSQLETQLDVMLFERTARGTKPTEEGLVLLEQARRVLAEADTLQELAAASKVGVLEGTIRLGVIPTIGPYLLPRMLLSLERAFPRLELQIEENLTSVLLEQLRDHRLDMAIVALPYEIGDDLCAIEAYEEPFYVGLPPDDPLADRTAISLDEIDGSDLLLLDEGHCLRDQALEACQTPASALRRQFRGASLETIRQFVLAGWGISLFPELTIRPDEPLLIRPLEPPAHRDIVVVIRQGYARAESARALADFLGEAIAQSD
ncbi:hydrogen peroxide-inducible genes activator [Persicimonas caeni]|uniref:Hydrogen peroxide-inducible genes activator n=1 Tax=Persicimonas caeni TaxID=2292766 RepID=A0A4Y6PR76_PERCE|nr:hydrogen peroxide-inducible genes activator [Persicimonas caeni]QDG50517.1 hydrogen peroxide-inducible genes activator [Persicimonas caeni]QED31738.1 hydrogen peroxide-inducible genes activator [Persicimonas caeni]